MSNTTSIIDADLSLSFTPEVLKGLQAFLSFINDGITIEGIFDVDAALANQEVAAAEIAYVKSNPEIAQLFEERYIAPTPDLEELLKLPEDSLGFAFASYLRELNFKPEFYPKLEVKDDASYFAMRIRQTHDIWHTVTGWFNDAGGIKLAGFQVAQTRSPLLTMVSTGIILNTTKMNKDITPIVRLLQEGYDVGSQAKPFLAQKWEEAWEKPLAEWRSELNINVS
jgi:ubiquinone biosynthesis protein Coq4